MLSHVLALGSYYFMDLSSFSGCNNNKKKSFLGFPESTAGLGCMTAPLAQHHTETWLLALNKIVPDILFLLQINILKEFVFCLQTVYFNYSLHDLQDIHTGMQSAELLKTSVLFYDKHEPVSIKNWK